MIIYDAASMQPIESPDLTAGYLVDGTIITGYTTEVMDGTVTDARPNGIRQRVPVTEACQLYYRNAEAPGGQGTDKVTWSELAAAYNEGVSDSGQ